MNIISDNFALTDLLPTAVAAILAVTQWYWNAVCAKRDELNDLRKRLDRILQMTIAHPELEHKSVTEKWIENRESPDETFMRYDQFCNILFNFLVAVYNYFDGDVQKIEKFIDVKSWVRLHRQNWEHPYDINENVDAYDKEFRDFINSYLH